VFLPNKFVSIPSFQNIVQLRLAALADIENITMNAACRQSDLNLHTAKRSWA